MDRCNFCGNAVTCGENHYCNFDAFDYTYSESQTFSENTFNRAQLRTDYKLPSFDIFSNTRVSYAQSHGNASSAGTSGNGESWYRPENDFPESFSISPVVTISTDVGEEDQRESGISDVINARGREEDEMSRQEYRWWSCNDNKMNCMDSPKCVIRTDHSDNSNVSALRNLVLNSDELPRRNVPENDQIHVPEYVNDGHTSLEMHSSLYSDSGKTAICVMEDISSETDKNAVAGPSGMCPPKKKYPCTLCFMAFNKKSHLDNHYRAHTLEKPFVCKVCEKFFSRRENLKVHIRTHTGEKPFVCKVCKKAFSRKGHLDTHIRTHTCEKPFECKICKKAFRQNDTLQTHILTHTREKPYKCPVCGNAYTTSGSRNRHQREKHK